MRQYFSADSRDFRTGSEPPAREKEMKNSQSWVKTNRGIGIISTIALVAFLIYLQCSPWVHRTVRDGFKLGFFPVLSVVLLVIFSILLIIDSRRKEVPKELADFTFKSFLGGIAILLATGAYFAIMEEIGFLIVTPIYLIIFIYLLGMKSWRSCVVSALIMTVTVYAAFSSIGIPMPAGLLSGVWFF